MKVKFFILSNSSGGMLLFAMITAMVMSFIGTTLIALTTNQFKVTEDEIKRKEAYYMLLAGREYANYMLSIGNIQIDLQPGESEILSGLPVDLAMAGVEITITKLDPSDQDPNARLSAYKIGVRKMYPE